ncbi:MAG: hypothetical protein QXP39_01710 [Candidatus Aenigmatarchaeota archaeon]
MKRKIISLAILVILFLASLNLSHELSAKQIKWSSVTFSLGAIVGAIVAAMYLERKKTVKFFKYIARRIKRGGA